MSYTVEKRNHPDLSTRLIYAGEGSVQLKKKATDIWVSHAEAVKRRIDPSPFSLLSATANRPISRLLIAQDPLFNATLVMEQIRESLGLEVYRIAVGFLPVEPDTFRHLYDIADGAYKTAAVFIDAARAAIGMRQPGAQHSSIQLGPIFEEMQAYTGGKPKDLMKYGEPKDDKAKDGKPKDLMTLYKWYITRYVLPLLMKDQTGDEFLKGYQARIKSDPYYNYHKGDPEKGLILGALPIQSGDLYLMGVQEVCDLYFQLRPTLLRIRPGWSKGF